MIPFTMDLVVSIYQDSKFIKCVIYLEVIEFCKSRLCFTTIPKQNTAELGNYIFQLSRKLP